MLKRLNRGARVGSAAADMTADLLSSMYAAALPSKAYDDAAQINQQFRDEHPLLAAFTGYGAYSYDGPNNPVSTSVVDQSVPQVSNPGGTDGPIVIRHREYITNIECDADEFKMCVAQLINPANTLLFPWLSNVATAFTQYRFAGLMFHFKSTSGSTGGTGATSAQALGDLTMCCNYNPTEPVFSTKVEMLNEVMAVSGAPCFDHQLFIETDQGQTHQNGLLFISSESFDTSAGTVGGRDARFYSPGVVYVSTSGQAAACTLGELWVSYQVELYKPQAVTSIRDSARTMFAYKRSDGSDDLDISTAYNWSLQHNSIGMVRALEAWKFPLKQYEQTYFVDLSVYGDPTGTYAPIINGVNCTEEPDLIQGLSQSGFTNVRQTTQLASGDNHQMSCSTYLTVPAGVSAYFLLNKGSGTISSAGATLTVLTVDI